MKRTILVTFLILFVLGSLGAIGYSVYYFFLMSNNKVVPAFGEGTVDLVVEGEQVISKYAPKLVDNEIMLSIEVIKKYLDPNIYWDSKLKKVTITTKDRVIRMKTDSLNAMVNNKPITLNIPAVEEDGTVFVPIEFLSDFYNIEITYLKETDVVIIDYENSLRQIAEPIDKRAVVRKGRSRYQPIIRKFDLENGKPEENTLRVFEEYEKWYKVRTPEGAIGYIEKRFVVVKRMMVKKMPEETVKNTAWKPEKGRINLVWEQTYSNRIDTSKIGKMEGLDVVSPTWLVVVNDKGKVLNRADAKFVEWAHNNGYKVWALLANDFGNGPMTSRFLRDTDARDNSIREILAYAALYKLDGINIDFENMPAEDKDVFTQYVREVVPLFREQGLTVSVDINTFPCYDRKALGEVVDYVALMAYDQHWKGSSVAGSVAQVPWAENLVNSFLKTIPREKLLLGLPFYTRLWKEETGSDGKITLSSQAVSMETAKKTIAENNAAVKWDEASGQFYAEFKKEGATFKVWLEDANSVDLRSALVQKYGLAGAAGWSRNFAEPQIWDVLNRNLKVVGNYQEWKRANENRNYVYNN